ncbi:MAG: hypothetical protein HYT93_00535 [Parcubacteria group bacterium]|nr:hypothetical protein [Parcubacteria group bacterium]
MTEGKCRVLGMFLFILVWLALEHLWDYFFMPWPSVDVALAILVRSIFVLTLVALCAGGIFLSFAPVRYLGLRPPTIDDPW